LRRRKKKKKAIVKRSGRKKGRRTKGKGELGPRPTGRALGTHSYFKEIALGKKKGGVAEGQKRLTENGGKGGEDVAVKKVGI